MSKRQKPSATKLRKRTSPDMRQCLITSAIQVFAQKGFGGTTVKDIASVAGANVALISYYFGGKEGIYREALSHYGQDRIQFFKQILTPALGAQDFISKLRLWSEAFIQDHLDFKAEVCMLHRELSEEDPITLEVFADLYLPFFVHLVDYFRHAIRSGFLHKDLDPTVVVSLMLSGLGQTLRYGKLAKRFFKIDFSQNKERQLLVENFVTIFGQNLLKK